MINDIPRGIEVLVKKAAVDREFKALLLVERSAVAAEIGLKLSDAEAAMLDGVPAAHLESIIANTKVSPKIRPVFTGRAAAVMLAALGVAAAGGCATTLGSQPDDPGDGPPITGPEDITEPGGGGPSEGIRPDIPAGRYGAVDYGDQAADADTEDTESPAE